MELKKRNEQKKLKKTNIVDPKKNIAMPMCYCNCGCYCSPDEHEYNKQGAQYNGALYNTA